LGRPVQTNLGYFGALPIELVLHIFGYLDGKDLLLNADVRRPPEPRPLPHSSFHEFFFFFFLF
jgi:hypothetical protein